MRWLSPLSPIHNRRIAVEREGAGTGDFHVQELAAMPVGTVEHDNFIAARPAGHPRRILFARPFNQNLRLLPDKRIVFALADFIDRFEQAMIAFLADF